ncbi:hypothetical protein BWI17_06290 [Betaproteobacteria bacterium GR16-43]|nr:hypothetical protein BWI17_06290 [Betaproteobacteria bacterium GR16-43]
MVSRAHPWKLVAPWYRWARAARPEDGRGSAPVLQKFSGDDFVERFLAQPQHSLVYDAQVDVVSRLDAAGVATTWTARLAAVLNVFRPPVLAVPLGPQVIAGPLAQQAAAAGAKLARVRAAPSALRKLFLPAHDRHYLVVCELHCDIPGFPTVPRDEACQAGFVVRRRKVTVPASLAPEAATRSAKLQEMEADLAVLETLAQPAPGAVTPRAADLLRRQREEAARVARRETLRLGAGAASWDAYLDAQRRAVGAKRAQLREWFVAQNLDGQVQAWLPGPAFDPRPRWTTLQGPEELSDTTHARGEAFFALVPLVPDPRLKDHDAAGRTIYFGVVPTVFGDHDAEGHARLDDQSTYEIRCFVRRHDPEHPRPEGAPDCCGEVTWSAPTEPYRLAPPFDLLGTAQRPVTIQMPDLGELAAQVAARPRGKLSPVKFVQPQHLSPNILAGIPTPSVPGGPAICFFSIPLITIVALFLLNIFLPIVVLIFNLWFLLALRFCITPQVSVSAGLDAALAATPPGVDLAADFAVSVGGVPQPANDLLDAIAGRVKDGIDDDTHLGDGPTVADVRDLGLAGLAVAFADAAALPDKPEDAPAGLGYREDLEYERHREAQWRLAAGGRG